MDGAGNPPGFDSHVVNQLQAISQQASSRGRGSRRGQSRGGGAGAGAWPPHNAQPNVSATAHNQQAAPAHLLQNPDAFPPLGAAPPSDTRNTSNYAPQFYPQPQLPTANSSHHGTPRDYQERARGHYRGGPRHFGPPQYVSSPAQYTNPAQFYGQGRPPARHGLYNPNAAMTYGSPDQQRNMRVIIMRQSDYLIRVGRKAYEANKLSQEEMMAKEEFRQELELLAREALAAKYPGLNKDGIKLRCYGSLANGFALTGCDMDLLLSVPDYPQAEKTGPMTPLSSAVEGPNQAADEDENGFHAELRRVLEKAYLDKEYGARLLTKTRVPILRICQKPPPELLQNLRENQASWEQSQTETPATEVAPQTVDEPSPTVESVDQGLNNLTLADTGRPSPAARGNSGLEFTGDCGTLCDVNFTNFVAIQNSALLRLYHSFDTRVHELGIFVKIWAKARDINTPYRGTLSSYGYILMVLHYLMNVVRPPIIPNLQHLAKIEDGWNPDQQIELFEGFDVRFVRDTKTLDEIRAEMAANRNRDSAGQLLRGFFQYYGTREGFHWTRDVISIRQKGGILTKQAKGWTEAKWAKDSKSVRLRYLLAIEDPFEVDHNIARTVGHHGIVNIRDEFRRAWSIIEKIGTDQEVPEDQFLEVVTARVDTLRQDQDFHRSRQLQMKQDLQAKEKALLEKADAEGPDPHTDGTSGKVARDINQPHSSPQNHRPPPNPKLTTATSPQDKNQRFHLQSWRHRRVEADSDDEDEDPAENNRDRSKQPQAPLPKAEETKKEPRKPSGGLCSRNEVLLANGYDHLGNPVAWDIETQEGRWLQWRDNKIRQGIKRENFVTDCFRELDEQCPYDSRRPSPYIGRSHENNHERMNYERPPWPANNPGSETYSPPLSSLSQQSNAVPGERSDTDVQSQGNPFASSQPGTCGRAVGHVIPWDVATMGGRWLRYRDRQILAGKWEDHTHSKYTELSFSFRYEPKMTWAELEDKNQQLRRYYKNGIHRIDQGWRDQSGHAEVNSTLSPTNNEAFPLAPAPAVAEHQRETTQLPAQSTCSNPVEFGPALTTKPSSHDQSSHETQPDIVPKTLSEYSHLPNVDFVRSQRLAFFAKQEQDMSSAKAKNTDHPLPGAADLKSADGEQLQTPIQSVQEPAQARSEIRSAPDESTPKAATFPPAEDQIPEDYGTENGSSRPLLPLTEDQIPKDCGSVNESFAQMTSEPKVMTTRGSALPVPTTLYPGLDSSRRPRDENPNIMPIPRDFVFQFDPRQLQDLAVIARGGNGCAREGEQFSIEDGYDWRGGGTMGWQTSTGLEYFGVSESLGHIPTPH